MKHAVYTASGGMICIPSFIKIGSDILKLMQKLSDNSRCRVLHSNWVPLDQRALPGNVNGLTITHYITDTRQKYISTESHVTSISYTFFSLGGGGAEAGLFPSRELENRCYSLQSEILPASLSKPRYCVPRCQTVQSGRRLSTFRENALLSPFSGATLRFALWLCRNVLRALEPGKGRGRSGGAGREINFQTTAT
jgi:hypothetical protein